MLLDSAILFYVSYTPLLACLTPNLFELCLPIETWQDDVAKRMSDEKALNLRYGDLKSYNGVKVSKS